MSAKYDLIIYGATGFTGRLAAQYMMRAGIGDLMRIAIAGRNREKLVAVQQSCEIQPDIIIANSAQEESIKEMVRNTNVVLSFAGPYSLYGEVIVAACAQAGVDYLDITGETLFIREMIKRYQAVAEESGARLIPFSGFDSVPADLMVYLALQAAKQLGLHFDDLSLYYQIKGGFNGGTLATALNTAEHPKEPGIYPPNTLVPDASWQKTKRPSLHPRYEPVLHRYTAPFFMYPINQAVVRRSLWLRHELGEEVMPFTYEERIIMPKRFGLLKAISSNTMLATFSLLLKTRLGRRFIRYMGPKPGEGPSVETRQQGFFRGQLVCRSRGDCKLMITMEREGDPGNIITVALACESARLAVSKTFASDLNGFLTPTIAFGAQLKPQLESAAFSFNIS